MKSFFRFYLLFSLITVAFSCSDDDSGDSQSTDPINIQFIRFGDNLVPSSVVPRTTYLDTDSNRQVTSYLNTDISGNIFKLSKLVGDDGSGLSNVISFDQNGIINSVYQQDPITGVISNKVFVLEDEATGNVYFGNEDGVQEIASGTSLSDFGNFLNSDDDLLASDALNTSKNIIEKLLFYGNDTSTNRSSLNLGALFIGAVAIIAIMALAGSATITTTVGEQINSGGNFSECQWTNSCESERRANNEENFCSIPYTDFICSEVVDVTESPCEDSDLEVIIGVDPGNLLVAIVNGDSLDYDFYWSTGEIDTGSCCDDITVSEDGTYYVIAVDDNGCVAFASATIEDDVEVDPSLLTGKTWYLTGETENSVNIFNPENCNITLEFNETQLFSTEFFGDECESSDEIPSNYEVNGNIITETAEGDTSFITILELTPFKLVLQEVDGPFTYVETYTNIFGGWSFSGNSNCVVSNGDTFTDNGSGEPLTLNNNYTVVFPDDSNGNYLSNSFTFENSILTINLSYQDFFSPACDGVNFQTAMNSLTLTYDNATNTFTGTSQSSRNDVIGSDCTRLGETCTGTVSMTR
ncbi:hypothetical protein SAMN04515667_1636 [Formosa sp. Hel1_31_208]|uniref:lipocalin family protein n=1 Tax=Formosa sp. Hel1_31_208 TaxID=1798225 RepID=UPI00087B4A49|nr:lipocalin family protein [Formosa sp. Hel1_31_208]SDS20009.1 hypothetical protein SAMN04515667_1636 [Formosa sp. Hel1_31_208]